MITRNWLVVISCSQALAKQTQLCQALCFSFLRLLQYESRYLSNCFNPFLFLQGTRIRSQLPCHVDSKLRRQCRRPFPLSSLDPSGRTGLSNSTNTFWAQRLWTEHGAQSLHDSPDARDMTRPDSDHNWKFIEVSFDKITCCIVFSAYQLLNSLGNRRRSCFG